MKKAFKKIAEMMHHCCPDKSFTIEFWDGEWEAKIRNHQCCEQFRYRIQAGFLGLSAPQKQVLITSLTITHFTYQDRLYFSRR